jgi:NAD(P)-dependent dehydrogenase (short-subunit alcohol dehydrogenase family)
MVARDRSGPAGLGRGLRLVATRPLPPLCGRCDGSGRRVCCRPGMTVIESQLGVPDVVIGCAGISVGVDTAIREDLDGDGARLCGQQPRAWRPPFHPVRATPCRSVRSGTLVGIASVNGIRGFPGHGAYCASKAAVISYCESLAGGEMRATWRACDDAVPRLHVDTPLTRGNRYAMPFPDDRLARLRTQAWRAIERGDSYRVIPWQMAWVAKLLAVLAKRGCSTACSRAARARSGSTGDMKKGP